MVTNVPKGAGRASAAKKTAKHAQRTPLPPRKGKVEAAKEVLTSAGVTPGKPSPRKAAKKAAPTVTEAPPASASGKPGITAAGIEKAKAFAVIVEPQWSTKISEGNGQVELVATRADESITMHWDGASFVYPGAYAYGSHSMNIRNVSQARQLAARSEDEAATEASRRGSARRVGAPRQERPRAPLPFDVKLALDDDVISHLRGHDIMWVNSISGTEEVATVPPEESIVTVRNQAVLVKHKVDISVNGEEERLINFCDPTSGGFRSVRVAALTDVGPAGSFANRRKRKANGNGNNETEDDE